IDFGYDVIGMVSKSQFLPTKSPVRHFVSFKDAALKTNPDILIQTDTLRSEDIYNYAIENHLEYMFVPQQDRLLSQINTIEVIGGTPIIDVKITKLFGMGRIWKRLMDLILAIFGLILVSPIMLIVAIIMKITNPKDSIFFKQVRLTRFNREFYIYKFRSQKAEFDGLTPEQAFEKMGKPELSKEYRKNGDQLDNDPRITKIGKFIRATSIDELPQLFNVVRGDISLVGPRALIPQEINKSNRKNIILAVKAGVTGLAQVSGRRDISFEERRRLDVYYVQNWSIIFDIQILFKTVASVIFRRGAK
ncbi:MAG: sugar transferase, partial [Candidatus Saccharimonas sp.]